MGNRLVDDVAKTERGGAATGPTPVSGEATSARATPDSAAPKRDSSRGRPPTDPTVVLGPRSKKLPLDSFAPKPDREDKPRQPRGPETKRRPTTLPPPRSAGNLLPSPTQTPRSMRVARLPPGVAAPPVVATPPRVTSPAPIQFDGATQVASPPPPPSPSRSAITEGARCAISEPTAVVTPLPFPILVVEGARRRTAEATEVVAPLPSPESPRAASTPSVVVEPGLAEPDATGNASGDRRRWLVAGAMGAATMAAAILFVVIGFSSPGVARDYPKVDRVAPEVRPVPAPPPVTLPAPERAAYTQPPREPVPPTELAAPVAAAPPPAQVQTPPVNAIPGPSDDSSRPPRPRTKVAPPPGATHRPPQIAKPPARPSSKPPVKPRPPTYDPDSLFLQKP
jgi:hypothetical protein